MGFLFSGIFWGIVLILLGGSIIINLVFHVHVPLFRILVALILIYLGLRVMVGGHWCCRSHGGKASCTGAASFEQSKDGEFSIVFGKGVVDAAAIFTGEEGRRTLRVNTVFGSSLVRVPKTLSIEVRATSVFAGLTMPDRSSAAFGETIYRNEAFRTAKDPSEIRVVEVNVVFGSCRIIEE